MNHSVLIVDDSPVLRAAVRRAVVQAGVAPERIREAGHGAEALESLAAERSDLVLLDLNMPVMSGYDFVAACADRAELADVRIIVVTTESNEERMATLREHGVRDFLRKPFEPEDLRALVQAAGE